MNKLKPSNFNSFLQTKVGENALRSLEEKISNDIISVSKYYIGTPDEKYFTFENFPENVVLAKKAYVTLNTIMGYETSEYDRFCEGKKQVPEILTKLGVRKIIDLFTLLYCFSVGNSDTVPNFSTIKMCRQSEISEGLRRILPLTSTTKLSIEEIMALGYGDKKNLAVCKYTFHKGSVFFDFEELGEDYLKPEEREVLLLSGNTLIARSCGYNDKYLGSDNKPALMYEVDVYPPHFDISDEPQEYLENLVFDEKSLEEIRTFYSLLNTAEEFPEIPKCYPVWKKSFQQLVFRELNKFL